ncbi:MAG: Kelch repeat-containing protein, partial [Endomicrobiales bacterium]
MNRFLLTAFGVLSLGAILVRGVAAAAVVTQENYFQFSAGVHDQTQVRGSGDAAGVELLFQWQNLDTAAPPARWSCPLAYDEGKKAAVLFGGLVSGAGANDTWEFDVLARTWRQVVPSGDTPSPRYAHALAPAGNGKILLFGGRDTNGNYNNETWIYDTQAGAWSSLTLTLSTAPCARAFFTLVPAGAGRLVLFGGRDRNGALLSDTWVFDAGASSWSLRSPSVVPPARAGAAAAFNSNDGCAYLFGGRGASLLQDLWSYDAASGNWQSRGAAPVSARENAPMFFDAR